MLVERPIRIVHVTVGFEYGGTERMLLRVLPRLDSKLYQAAAACLKGWGPVADELCRAGIPTISLGGKGRLDPLVFLRLCGYLSTNKPVILHSHLYRANLACRLAGRLLRVPLVISSVRESGSWMRWHHRMLDRISARYAAVIITNSSNIAIEASTRIGIPLHRFVTIPNGVELEAFKHAGSSTRINGPNRIGFIGRLQEPGKGLSYLIDALSILKRDVECWIVGNGPAMEQLKRRCEQLCLSSRVMFLGTQKDIPNILERLDLVVLPSLDEGSPNVLIEAMAAGKAVVATSVGGVPEIVVDRETGLLVRPADARALAEAIRMLLDNPEERRQMGKAGRIRAEECFRVEKEVSALSSLYERLLAERAKGENN